ncbi:MAG: ROK family transcriptional regulator [Alphaproteobacteria bacterium]|nr:ROK family transcriptional regulator [Alphaproteobacteria bacterium]
MTIGKKNWPSPGRRLTQSRYHRGVTGSNWERTGKVNRRVVLEAIRIHGPLERTDIVARTGLAVQTVSNIVNELIEDGFVKKCPAIPGRLGPPAYPLDIEPDGAFSIGLSLDQRSALGCIANLAGETLASEELPIEGLSGPDAFQQICSLIGRLRTAPTKTGSPILGVGIAVSGPFGVRSYLMDGPTSAPAWLTNVIVDELSSKIGMPIEICNDSTASTIGQRIYGVAKDISAFAHLFVGFGVAVGYFLNDRVYCGADGNAGEIGHTMLMPGGHSCFCGGEGCLEQYLSLYSARHQLGIDVFSDAGLDRFCERLADPDPKMLQWLDEAAEVLRRAVHMIEQLLDPGCIVVGGYMPRPVLEAILKAATPLYPSIRQRDDNEKPRVLLGATGRDVGVLSASALPLYSRMNPALDIVLKK